MNEEPKRIDFSKTFDKQLRLAPLKIKTAFQKRFELFLADSFHPQLNNHLLSGKFWGHRSISVTGDWRAIFRVTDDSVIFEALGTHSQLYK